MNENSKTGIDHRRWNVGIQRYRLRRDRFRVSTRLSEFSVNQNRGHGIEELAVHVGAVVLRVVVGQSGEILDSAILEQLSQ